MRWRVAVALAVGGVVFAVVGIAPAVAGPSALSAPAAVAHKCSSGYVHAIIGGSHKCLHTGQICANRYETKYRAKGFTCKRGSDGKLRLFRR